MCSTGGQNSKSHQYSCRENPTNGMKRQRDMIPEEEAPRSEGIQNATGEEQRAITISSSKNEEAGTKLKWHLVVDVFGDASEVGCRKEQYCIGTWNVRSMDQGKLEVVKQEMARVNIDISGISELKWTRMGEFNSDDHYIYYCGQESRRRNGAALIVNKSLTCSICVQSQKWQWSRFISKANHSTPQ